MKIATSIIFGACIILFLVMAKKTFDSYYLKDDKIDADDVFNEYLSDKNEQNQNLQSQNAALDDFKQNLINCKAVVDSISLPKLRFVSHGDTLITLRTAVNEIISSEFRIRSFLVDSASNQTILKSADRIKNSLANEFYSYESILYSSPIRFTNYGEMVVMLSDEKTFGNHKLNVSNVISQQITSLTAVRANYKLLTEDLSNKIKNVKETQKNATENTRDRLLITMVIPIFAVILAIIIFIPYFLRNQQQMFDKILDDKILIQVFTIFILVISILLLGIGGKLSGETLGTLLGGISVYVLQKSLDPKNVIPGNQVTTNNPPPKQ